MKSLKINPAYAHLNDYGHKPDECIETTHLLIKNLPSHIFSSKTKKDIRETWYVSKPTIAALRYDKWICFNSKERVSLVVFDIDNKNKNLQELYDFVVMQTDNEPAWLIETDNGFQFGYVLQNSLYTHQAAAYEKLRSIKRVIIDRVGCDETSSMRNYGFFRNPLAAKKYIFNPFHTVEFSDFNAILPKVEYRKRKVSTYVVKRTAKGFEIGKRHKFLLVRGLEIAKKNHYNTIESLTADIYEYQQNMKTTINKLDIGDIKEIAKSVYRYWMRGDIFEFIGTIDKKNTPRTKVSIKEEYGRYLDDEEFKQALSKRRVEHAHITNNIRPKNHLKKCTKIRQKKAAKKAAQVYKYLKKNKLKLTQKNLIDYSKKILEGKGISRDTARVFLKNKK
jgi:cell division protein FtsB